MPKAHSMFIFCMQNYMIPPYKEIHPYQIPTQFHIKNHFCFCFKHEKLYEN